MDKDLILKTIISPYFNDPELNKAIYGLNKYLYDKKLLTEQQKFNIFINALKANDYETANRWLPEIKIPDDSIDEVFIYADVNILNQLIEDPRITTDNLNTALETYSIHGDIDMVNQLLKYPDIDSYGISEAFISAAKYGHLNIINRLIEDPRYKSTSEAMQVAIYYQQYDIVDRLLEE